MSFNSFRTTFHLCSDNLQSSDWTIIPREVSPWCCMRLMWPGREVLCCAWDGRDFLHGAGIGYVAFCPQPAAAWSPAWIHLWPLPSSFLVTYPLHPVCCFYWQSIHKPLQDHHFPQLLVSSCISQLQPPCGCVFQLLCVNEWGMNSPHCSASQLAVMIFGGPVQFTFQMTGTQFPYNLSTQSAFLMTSLIYTYIHTVLFSNPKYF